MLQTLNFGVLGVCSFSHSNFYNNYFSHNNEFDVFYNTYFKSFTLILFFTCLVWYSLKQKV